MPTADNYERYAWFNEKKLKLGGMLNEASAVIRELNMDQFSENLAKLSEKVNSDTFKIQVVGTFKNGKSTFINSLLGEYILPAYALPCTAVINEIKYGEEKKAVLYFRNPLPEKLFSDIPPKALQHMQAHHMKDIPPMEIAYNEIEDYVVIPIGSDPMQMLLESPYEKVELFWPLPMLKEGVEIIDSPGLNEHATRTRVTLNYLSQADAILFILNATMICSLEEMTFIEDNLCEQGFTDPFFVVNRWDIIDDREKDKMKRYVSCKLEGFTTNEIFYISALNALKAKEEQNDVQYAESGMKAFETTLSDFLTKQKGKVKLTQPARELKRILTEEALYKAIPGQRQMLSSSLADVKARYEASKPKLAVLKAKKEQLVNRMLLKIEQNKHEFRRISLGNSAKLVDLIPGWIDAFEPEAKFGAIPTRGKSDKIVAEITGHVSEKVEEYQKNWQKEVLQPLIEERTSVIFDSVESDLSHLFDEIDLVNVQISGRQDYNPSTVPVWQRIAGVVGGLAVGDVGLAASAGINGFSKELAKTAAFEIGAGALLFALGLLNPFTIAAVLFGALVFNWKKGASNAMKKLKNQIADDKVKQFSEGAETSAAQVSEQIASKWNELANQISSAVDSEIKDTENQVQAIITEMEKGQAAVDANKRTIDGCEEKIKQLNTELDAMIFQLVEEC